MIQKSLNDLLVAEDKAGWIEKRREGMGCGIKELEASWNRNVERYKKTLPSEKTQLKTLLKRATGKGKGSRFQYSRAFLEKDKPKPKSSLRKVSPLSTNALTVEQQRLLTLSALNPGKDMSAGKRKRKTRKRRKRRRTKKKRLRKRRRTRKKRKRRR